MLKSLLNSIVKEDVLKEVNTPHKLVNINLKRENLKTAKHVYLGIVTELALSKINEKEVDKLHFRKRMQTLFA